MPDPVLSQQVHSAVLAKLTLRASEIGPVADEMSVDEIRGSIHQLAASGTSEFVTEALEFGDGALAVGELGVVVRPLTGGLTKLLPRLRPSGGKPVTVRTTCPCPASESASAPSKPRVRTVYHKGELLDGKVGSHRPLSTSPDRSTVDALRRAGTTHQFDIPEEVYFKWELDGKIRTITDLDLDTGVINNELRFDRSIAPSLNEYKR